MNRRQLEHLIRAASTIAEDDELIIVGSQATGWCISVADLVVSKYVAGREKDRSHVRAALAHGLVGMAEILARLAVTPIDDQHRARIETLVRADAEATAPVE